MGGILGPNGLLYGIPFHSPRVLEYDPLTRRTTYIGINLKKYNCTWWHGCLCPDGKIICFPWTGGKLLVIDPMRRSVRVVSTNMNLQDSGWIGGVYSSISNKMYLIPYHAKQVLEINPQTLHCRLIGSKYAGGCKWSGGVLGDDGCIYGIPCSSSRLLRISARGSTSLVGDDLGPKKYKWDGGVCVRGCIYGIPDDGPRVFKYEISTERATLIGESYRGGDKWRGGVACNGSVYALPCSAQQILRIDATTNDTSLLGEELGGMRKWVGAVQSDGRIYGVPSCHAHVLQFEPPSDIGRVMTIDEDTMDLDMAAVDLDMTIQLTPRMQRRTVSPSTVASNESMASFTSDFESEDDLALEWSSLQKELLRDSYLYQDTIPFTHADEATK